MVNIIKESEKTYIDYNSYDFWQLYFNDITSLIAIFGIIMRIIYYNQDGSDYIIKIFLIIFIFDITFAQFFKYLCRKKIVIDRRKGTLEIVNIKRKKYIFSEIEYIHVKKHRDTKGRIISYKIKIVKKNIKYKLVKIHFKNNLDNIIKIFEECGIKVVYEKY